MFAIDINYGHLNRYVPGQLRVSREFLKNAGLLIGMYLVVTFGVFAVVRAASGMPSCTGGESVISYPRYDAKGVVVDQVYRCGIPTKGCTYKGATGDGTLFQCPALFMPLD